MKKSAAAGLLPVGMTDVLPPFASNEADAVEKILGFFENYAYQRVTPPLAEFEETLFCQQNDDLRNQTFRLIDPLSGKMMGIRADMTAQIGRIALTRLSDEPRPLRLAYSGHVLRLNGTQLNPARQILQVGAELVGADVAQADAEVVLLALGALKRIGIENVSIDLNLPTLFPALCRAYAFDREDTAALADFVNQKDFSAASEFLDGMGEKGKSALPVFDVLCSAYGDCDRVTALLSAVDLPDEARAECRRLAQVAEVLKNSGVAVKITADALENRGFEYHCGIAFTLYDADTFVELGRGGRYIASVTGKSGEPAVGVTLLMTEILSVLKIPAAQKRVYVPVGTPFSETEKLKGYAVVCGLSNDAKGEARRLSCDFIYSDGVVRPL